MHRKLVIATLALLLPLTAAVAASAQATAAKRCGEVAFTRNSDDAATHIRAVGLTCGLARDFVRDSKGKPGRRFRGFTCTSEAVDGGAQLAYRAYRCTGAGDRIRWRRY